MDPQYSKGSLGPASRNRQAPAASGFKTHAFWGAHTDWKHPKKSFFIWLRTELVPCTGGRRATTEAVEVCPRGHHGM